MEGLRKIIHNFWFSDVHKNRLVSPYFCVNLLNDQLLEYRMGKGNVIFVYICGLFNDVNSLNYIVSDVMIIGGAVHSKEHGRKRQPRRSATYSTVTDENDEVQLDIPVDSWKNYRLSRIFWMQQLVTSLKLELKLQHKICIRDVGLPVQRLPN
jgi:hypothetical protein